MIEPYYQSEKVKLYCGDCLEILPMLSGVDAVVTDPPYGVGLNGKRTKRDASHANAGYANLADDDSTITESVLPAIGECQRLAARVIVMPGIRSMWKYPEPADCGAVFNPSGAGLGRWGFVCFHPILYYGRCPYLARGLGHRPSGFSDIAAGEVVEGHPCPKPLRWMEWLVRKASVSQDDTILDPFMGSGTTGVAAVRLGRKFIGIEIDKGYCEIAKRRIQEAEQALALFEPATPEKQAEMF